MSDAVDQARDLLADPPIGVEVWGPIVEGLLDEMSEVQAEVQDRDDALVDVRNGLKAARADDAKARNVIERVRAMLEVASDQLHDAAHGIGEYSDAHEWLEYAAEMVRYGHLIADGNEEQVPERYRQKVARILDEAERGEGS